MESYNIGFLWLAYFILTSQVALVVENLPANAGDLEMQVQSLGWEDPLEKEMGAHSSILAWKIPWMAEPCGLQSMGHKELDMTEPPTHTHLI